MPTFLYRCPNTGFKFQGYSAEETSDESAYEAVSCIMCRQIHLVNPAAGKVLGESDE